MSHTKPPKTYAGAKATVLRWIRKDGKNGAAADFGFVRTEHGHNVYLQGVTLWKREEYFAVTPKPKDTLVLNYREGTPSHLATSIVSYQVVQPKPKPKPTPQSVTGRGRVSSFDAEKGFGFLELDKRFGDFEGKVHIGSAAILASMDPAMPEVLVKGDWLQCTVTHGSPSPTASRLVTLELVDRDSNVVNLEEWRKTGTNS